MNNIEIPILKNNTVQPIFISANHKLVNKNKDKFTCDEAKNLELLVNLWKEEYKATLDLKNKKILFETNRDRTVFLLK